MSVPIFPGMDPYLEGHFWTTFHASLAGQIQIQLMPRLRPKYVALLEKHYAIDRTGFFEGLSVEKRRDIYPDVDVSQPRVVKEIVTDMPTFVLAPSAEVISPLPENVPVTTIEIREVSGRRLVTDIEILSPVNKRGPGATEYAERRTSILGTSTHLLELDLLRGGSRFPVIGDLPPAPYYVFLSRVNRRPRTEVWPIRLRDPLPAVPVPLLPPDADVPLDLQAAVRACFDLVGYENLLDYSQPLPPPELNTGDIEWVKERLKGLNAQTN
ncbi:MAG: DUF4058 family protein [Chloroflexota bacterium]